MSEGGALTCEFTIGTTAGSKPSATQAVTVEDVGRIAGDVFPNYASVQGIGSYEGKKENFVVVKTLELVEPKGITNCVRFCENANNLVSRVLSELHQDSVLVEVKVLPHDRKADAVTWHSFADADRPNVFPRPAAIARYIIPSEVYRSLRRVYEVARETYVKEWPDTGDSVKGVPVVWFPFDSPTPFEFDGREASEFLIARLSTWDSQFIQTQQHVPERPDSWSEELGEFLSRFQSMSPHPCFFVANLPSFVRGEATKLELGKCNYVFGATHCEAHYLDALDHSFSTARQALEGTHDYWHKRIRNVFCEAFPILGITVVTVCPRNGVLVKKRSKTVAAYPEAFHLAPCGMVEDTRGFEGPSIVATFLREFYEEFFDVDAASENMETFSQLLAKPQLGRLKGVLQCHGFGVDLLRSSAAFLCSFRIADAWWNEFYGQIRMNWEYAEKTAPFEPWEDVLRRVLEDPASFVPEAVAALTLCRQEETSGAKGASV